MSEVPIPEQGEQKSPYLELPVGVCVMKNPGTLYRNSRGRIDHPDGPSIGFMFAGETYEGRFAPEELQRFETETGLTIEDLHHERGWGHVAVIEGGEFECGELCGVSLEEDSEVYVCPVDHAAFFPE